MFAGYMIVRLLGSGGMGEVYLAEHPRLPRQDALKILGTDISAGEEYRQRFIREADLAAKLWHPNIVRVNDRGEFNGQLWIAMDYVDGTDAASLLRDRYPAGEVAAIITAIASALDHAHQRGLLHRDVKPANILLGNPADDDERRILLGDFGIARDIGDVSGLTATNMTVGTLPYAAPEQLMDDQVDGRADQYALAATTGTRAIHRQAKGSDRRQGRFGTSYARHWRIGDHYRGNAWRRSRHRVSRDRQRLYDDIDEEARQARELNRRNPLRAKMIVYPSCPATPSGRCPSGSRAATSTVMNVAAMARLAMTRRRARQASATTAGMMNSSSLTVAASAVSKVRSAPSCPMPIGARAAGPPLPGHLALRRHRASVGAVMSRDTRAHTIANKY